MSPPQHAHFITSEHHKNEGLFNASALLGNISPDGSKNSYNTCRQLAKKKNVIKTTFGAAFIYAR